MSKIDTVVLKLTGKKTYLTPLLYSIPFKKGDVIRMPLEIAGKIAGLMERREETNIYHFQNVTSLRGIEVTHDVTTPAFLDALKEMGKQIDKPRLAELALVNPGARETDEATPQTVQNDKSVVESLTPENSPAVADDEDQDDNQDEAEGDAEGENEQPAPAPAPAPKPAAVKRSGSGQRKAK